MTISGLGFLILAAAAPGEIEVKAGQAGGDEGPVICRKVEQTSSRIGNPRVCQTRKQWRLEKEQAETTLQGRRDMTDVEPVKASGGN